MMKPELILRLGLEIFYILSNDASELELKRVMNFIKF